MPRRDSISSQKFADVVRTQSFLDFIKLDESGPRMGQLVPFEYAFGQKVIKLS